MVVTAARFTIRHLKLFCGKGLARAKGAFRAMKADQLSFAKGEMLSVVDHSGKWWVVKNAEGGKGRAPSNYLEIVAADLNDNDESPQQLETPATTAVATAMGTTPEPAQPGGSSWQDEVSISANIADVASIEAEVAEAAAEAAAATSTTAHA